MRGTYEFLEGSDAAPLFAFYIEGETAKAIWEGMPQEAQSDACNPSPYKRVGGLLCFAPVPGSDEPYLCQAGLNLATGATELVEGC